MEDIGKRRTASTFWICGIWKSSLVLSLLRVYNHCFESQFLALSKIPPLQPLRPYPGGGGVGEPTTQYLVENAHKLAGSDSHATWTLSSQGMTGGFESFKIKETLS
jgi:hypothetical protein